VLCPQDPDDMMNELLLKYSPGNRLFFIKGDARRHDDLGLAAIQRQVIFVSKRVGK
jgi:hypothetical protein